VWRDDGTPSLHVAASVRCHGAVDDQLRYRGKPASNVTDDYVDTGKVPGDHAWHTGLEALCNVRGYSLLAECVRAGLSTHDGSNPTLDGYHVTASWVVTGEHRPYDRKAGDARRVLSSGRWGAVELIGRVGRVDLDDGSVRGGTMDVWWGSGRFKTSIGYGDIDLDRFGMTGNTRTMLTCLQWIH